LPFASHYIIEILLPRNVNRVTRKNVSRAMALANLLHGFTLFLIITSRLKSLVRHSAP